jgi:hypothetical protein
MDAGVRKIGRGGLPTGKLCMMALLPIFCVARFSRTDLSMIGARALKSGELPTGGMPPTYEPMH